MIPRRLALLLPGLAATRAAAAAPAAAAPEDPLAQIGRACAEADPALARMTPHQAEAALSRRLACAGWDAALRADFLAGDIVRAGGWHLARTEAIAAMLAWRRSAAAR